MQGLRMLYDDIPWFLMLAVPVAAVTLVIARRRHRDLPSRDRGRRLLLDVALALCLLGFACVTRLPTVGGGNGLGQGLQLRPFTSIIAQLTSALDASVTFRIVGLNIVLFIPLGFLLRLRPLRWRTTVAVVAANSLTIETLQAVLPRSVGPPTSTMCCSTPSAGSWVQRPGACCSGGEHSSSPLKSPNNQTRRRELDREQRAFVRSHRSSRCSSRGQAAMSGRHRRGGEARLQDRCRA